MTHNCAHLNSSIFLIGQMKVKKSMTGGGGGGRVDKLSTYVTKFNIKC